MTRQIIILLVLFISIPFKNYTRATSKNDAGMEMSIADPVRIETSVPSPPLPIPVIPVDPGLVPPSHKMHVPVMEELAKIHRFHRERLKRIRKHEAKCWLSAKLLLIICHLVLLICAYLHATH